MLMMRRDVPSAAVHPHGSRFPWKNSSSYKEKRHRSDKKTSWTDLTSTGFHGFIFINADLPLTNTKVFLEQIEVQENESKPGNNRKHELVCEALLPLGVGRRESESCGRSSRSSGSPASS